MPELKYLIGDATDPAHKPAMILHCCNDGVNGKPAWGRGFVIALSKKYPKAEEAYRDWFRTGKPLLGDVQYVQVADDVMVGNMIAQHGIRWQGKTPPIRYDALEACFIHAYDQAIRAGMTVAMPRVGAVLAGGRWGTIEGIIKKTMTVDSYVYTLEGQKNRWPTQYEKRS